MKKHLLFLLLALPLPLLAQHYYMTGGLRCGAHASGGCEQMQAPCPAPYTAQVRLELQTDAQADETSWTLTDVTLDSVIGQGQGLAPNTSYAHSFCGFIDHCYRFVIRDAGSNGLSSAKGYRLFRNGELLQSDAYFDDAETTEWGACCTDFSVALRSGAPCVFNHYGQAHAEPTGGTAPFQYQWSDGLSHTTIHPLAEDDTGIAVTVTDAAGCVAADTLQVTGLAALWATVQTACGPGPNSGAALALAASGVPPYHYRWSNGGQGSSVGGLSPGLYTVTLTDAGGCTAVATGEVLAPNACYDHLELPLEKGWNLASSYIGLHTPGMLDVLAPVAAQIIILKDARGFPVAPSIPVDNLGAWSRNKGYQIKTTEIASIPIAGTKIDPTAHPLPIAAGWQIIPYLRDSPDSIVTQLAGVENNITLVKDNEGRIYAPEYGVNQIKLLAPWKGYWFKAKTSGVLMYGANFGGLPPDEMQGAIPYRGSPLQHFIEDIPNTGSNASLIVPAAVADSLLDIGDELGVFSPGGMLCGAEVFDGDNFAVAIWGDDPNTSDVMECLATGEHFSLKIWKAAANAEHPADFNLQNGAQPAYEFNGIYVLEQLSQHTGLSETSALGTFRYFPNPATKRLQLQFQLTAGAHIRVELISAEGRSLRALVDETFPGGDHNRAFDIAPYPTGAYFLKVSVGAAARLHQLIIEKN